MTVVIHVINSLGYGGAERQLSLLAPAMTELGYSQSVIPLVHSGEGNGVLGGKVLQQPDFRPLAIARALFLATSQARAAPGCTLIGWMYHSWLVALFAHVFSGRKSNLLFYCRHGDPSSLSNSTRALAVVLLRTARRLKIPVVFNSRLACSSHQALVPGLTDVVIPNALNPSVRGVASLENVIGFLGRNHQDKGADLLVEIVCRLHDKLPDWRFEIAGPGIDSLEAGLRARLADEDLGGERVRVRGSVADVDSFFGEIAVLIVPSRAESFPNVLIEAMAMGVIPVCTSVGDIPDILNGVIPAARDIDDLVGLTVAFCQMQASERSAVGASLKRLVIKYELSNIVNQHAKIWGPA